MLELFQKARWDQAYMFLTSGEPPMMFRLLAINTLFLVLYIIRRAKSPHKMRESTIIKVQALLLASNCLILFQREIQSFIGRLS